MNVQDALREALNLAAVMKAADKRLKTVKGYLHHEALRRFQDDGAAPTWRVAGGGSVSLAGCPSPGEDPHLSLDVVDLDALEDWCVANAPGAIRQIVDTDVIAATYRLLAAGDKIVTGEGEVIPGLAGRPRQPYLTVRPASDVVDDVVRALADVVPESDLTGQEATYGV